mgnify:CR=1 FL=1
MAVTTDAFDATELVAMIPEVWTPLTLEEMFAKTVLANFVTDLTSWAADGGDILHVPDVYTNSFSVQSQSTQGAEVTTEAPAQNDVTLTIGTHSYIAYLLGDKDMRQLSKMYDFNEVYAKKAGATLADALEDALAALWSGLSTNSIGDTATVLADLEVRQSINALAGGNFDLRECAWFFHPTVFWTQIAAVQKYYDASQIGLIGAEAKSLTKSGNFGPMDASRGLHGSLYGIPLFVSTNMVSGLQTFRNLLLHKDCLAFALQTPGGSKVRTQADYLVQNIAALTVLDMVYGVVELRDAAGVVVNANNTATTA